MNPKYNLSPLLKIEDDCTPRGPAMVYPDDPVRLVRRTRHFEVGPMQFVVWLREINSRLFRLHEFFGMLHETRTDSMPHGSNMQEEAVK